MDNEAFTQYYFQLLCAKMAPLGFAPEALVRAVWAGTAAMVQNSGSVSNETVFWEKFAEIMGERVWDARPILEDFYTNEFNEAKAVCGYNQKLVDLVHDLKRKGFRVALATNPIFPKKATENRIGWAGLDPSDFALYTTYETIGYCKPNPEYYREILRRLRVTPEETAMVGNDVKEDMAAQSVGMSVFLLTDCVLNKENRDIRAFPNGDADALRKWLRM